MEFIAKHDVYLDKIVAENPLDIKEITVPEGFELLTEEVFTPFPNLERVILPKSLHSLDTGCFRGCKKLKDIVMPGVTNLYSNYFEDCVSVETLVVPKTIQQLGSDCFLQLTNLKKLVFEGLDNFEYAAFVAFNGVDDSIVVYPEESEKPVYEYEESMGAYTIDEDKASALRGKPPIVQAREYVIEDIPNIQFPPISSDYRYCWRIEAFAKCFLRVRGFIMREGLLVGFMVKAHDEKKNIITKPILVGQTVPQYFESHTVGGDNNGAGYKGGESFENWAHISLLPYGWDKENE